MLLFQTINLDDEVDDVVHELVIPHDRIYTLGIPAFVMKVISFRNFSFEYSPSPVKHIPTTIFRTNVPSFSRIFYPQPTS
jgi:hypothetical protein